MTDRELIQQALEKLEFFENMKSVSKNTKELITALRERLAQPVQEPFCYHDGRNIVGKEFADHSDVFPLYTSPPASKPWVGLTEYERADVYKSIPAKEFCVDAVGIAIEAKLKEKNNG